MTLRHSHIRELESESVFLMREVAAQFERPVLLFSGGKDSILMVHLARKAFYPASIPFLLVHIDTGHNFPETLAFRDELVADIGANLHVGSVQDSIDAGRVKEEEGPNPSRNGLQTTTLLDTLAELKADVALGGGRRDEEKARAKERFFSHRDRFGQWDPKNQRPELWNLFNGRRKAPGEHFRVPSRCPTGPRWMCGNTSRPKTIPMPSNCTSRTSRLVVERDGVLARQVRSSIRLLEGEEWEERVDTFPHHRRHDLHRRQSNRRRLNGGRHHRRSVRERGSDRTRWALGRQTFGSSHGRPEKAGVLLMDLLRFSYGRFGRRRKVAP